MAASNYTNLLIALQRFEEARSLLRKMIPVARRALGDNDEDTIRMRWNYAKTFFTNETTPDDLREAVATLEDTHRIARRVLGAAHPTCAELIGPKLQFARGFLCAREKERESSQPG